MLLRIENTTGCLIRQSTLPEVYSIRDLRDSLKRQGMIVLAFVIDRLKQSVVARISS